MAASSSSWKNHPFSEGMAIPYHASFNEEQFTRLINGFVPRNTNDRWFIYYDEPHLLFHRSLTGQSVYRLALRRVANGAETIEALCSRKDADRFGLNPEYRAQVIDYLIGKFLLGQERRFPRRPMPVNPRWATFEQSWDNTIKFVEEMPSHNVLWTPWTEFLLPLLRQCYGLGLNKYFRAGQSMSDIIISSAENHGLESYDPPPPRITIRFERKQSRWFIAWSCHNLLTGPPPNRATPVDSETAFDTLRAYLIDLWRETRPEQEVPKALSK